MPTIKFSERENNISLLTLFVLAKKKNTGKIMGKSSVLQVLPFRGQRPYV
jgi:hypothetical protein